MEPQNQTDLLQDIREEMNFVDPVSPGIRFANYLIDQIVLIVIINGGEYVFGIISRGESYTTRRDLSDLMLGFLISLLINLAYYTIFETATNGRTIGKLLTGTTAITQDGSPFTFRHALLRTLCRFIPFEPFSAFGYMPWHDSITKTAVVKKTW